MAANGLVKHIGVGQGIALYVSAILGAGVLALPGQVASLAGPASLVSWAVAGLLGVPLASMFLALGQRFPDAGGVASYARAGFGPWVGGVTGWMFFVAGSLGQTIVPLTGGYYVARAVAHDELASKSTAFAVAFVILVTATVANLAGVRVNAGVQLVLAAVVGIALTITIVVAAPRMDFALLEPFAPHGLAPVGAAVVILFFAFAGWEAIAHLAGEFRDPDRDLPRAVGATIIVVTTLYLGAAAAVVLTGTYGSPDTDRVAVALILEREFGPGASIAAAVLAVIISLGTTNAFIAGVSRLAGSLADDGWLPRPVGRITPAGVPRGGVVAVSLVAAAGLGLAVIRDWGTDTLVVVPSTLVVAVYVIAAASAVRVLRGWGRAAGAITLAITLLVVPTAAENALIPLVVAVLALAAKALLGMRQPPVRLHP